MSPAAGMATLSGAPHGLAYGGFFTLYSFAVAGSLPGPATGGRMPDLPAAVEPHVDRRFAAALTDDPDPAADGTALPTTRPVKPGAPAFVLAGDDADPLGRLPLPGGVDPVRPYGPVLMPASADVPEPSTLLLAGLAVLALWATTGMRRASTGWR
jgi:hypothetical protein